MSRCLTHLSVRGCPQDSPTMMILHKERVFVGHFRFVKRLPKIDLDFRKFILKPYPTYLQITMSFSKMKQILFKNSMILPNMLLLLPNKNETDPKSHLFLKNRNKLNYWMISFQMICIQLTYFVHRVSISDRYCHHWLLGGNNFSIPTDIEHL